MGWTYRIVRYYRDRKDIDREVIATGLTSAQARAHCNSPETSSDTATSKEAKAHTKKYGPWFDGFRKE